MKGYVEDLRHIKDLNYFAIIFSDNDIDDEDWVESLTFFSNEGGTMSYFNVGMYMT